MMLESTQSGSLPNDRQPYILGLYRSDILSLLILAASSAALALIMIASNGNVLAGTAFLGAGIILIITFYRLDWGFLLFIGMVLGFDQFEIPGFESLTYKISYFANLKTITYLPRLNSGVVNPLELHLALLFFVWFLVICVRKDVKLNRIPVWFASTTTFLWLIVSFVSGMRSGGDFMAALWEARALFYLGLMYFFVPQIIKTREQIQAFIWVCIIAISFKALEGASRFVRLGFGLGGYDALLTHEDPVFIITMMILLLGLLVFGVQSSQKKFLSWLFVPLLLGFYAANRRAAYASLGVSILAFAVLLPKEQILRFSKVAVPVVLVLALYTAVLWDSSSNWATPIQQIRSGFEEDEAKLGERNYYSNLYRRLEDYNLAVTIQNAPVLGIGFGTRYSQPLTLARISYTMRDYMAHNNVIWLFVKIGAIGFFLFWFFIDGFACLGGSTLSRLKDPYLQVVCTVIIVAVISQIVAAYFDLHLVRYRTMLYMGALMGLLPALETASRQPSSSEFNFSNAS
jgi:hypothetical protein